MQGVVVFTDLTCDDPLSEQCTRQIYTMPLGCYRASSGISCNRTSSSDGWSVQASDGMMQTAHRGRWR